MELLVALAVLAAGIWYIKNKKRPDYNSQVKGSGGEDKVDDPRTRG